MSEQSGPITREQVERAIDAAYDCNAQGVNAALGAFWYEREDIPADVRDGWRQVGYLGLRIALTRWRDELAAAEPVRRVARWDAELEAYALTPIHDDGALMTHAVEDAAKARDWGYEIEGGPEPVRDWKSDRAIVAIWPTPKPVVHIGVDLANGPDWTAEHVIDDSPERLRERREGIPWTLNEAAAAVSKTPSNLIGVCIPWQAADVSLCEGKSFAGPAYAQCRALYAAALSAEEARRAAKAKPVDIGYVPTDRERYPERPAPRFKVGDRVTSGLGGPWKIGRVEWGRLVPEADCDEWVYHHASGNVSACESVLALAWTPTPASPPAPEVVDVPQPRIVVKRCDEVEAEWTSADATILIVTHDALDDAIFVPIALLRAMLAAIDAQQGGAS
jgi:hypothetical protein